jgi:hypothetical protein
MEKFCSENMRAKNSEKADGEITLERLGFAKVLN